MFAFSAALLTRVYKGNAIPDRSAEDMSVCNVRDESALCSHCNSVGSRGRGVENVNVWEM